MWSTKNGKAVPSRAMAIVVGVCRKLTWGGVPYVCVQSTRLIESRPDSASGQDSAHNWCTAERNQGKSKGGALWQPQPCNGPTNNFKRT